MLPARLQEVKEKLTARRARLMSLSVGEKELLAELEILDTNQLLQKSIRENFTKIVSGPSDRCSCCGR